MYTTMTDLQFLPSTFHLCVGPILSSSNYKIYRHQKKRERKRGKQWRKKALKKYLKMFRIKKMPISDCSMQSSIREHCKSMYGYINRYSQCQFLNLWRKVDYDVIFIDSPSPLSVQEIVSIYDVHLPPCKWECRHSSKFSWRATVLEFCGKRWRNYLIAAIELNGYTLLCLDWLKWLMLLSKSTWKYDEDDWGNL